MTPQNVIDSARILVNDNHATIANRYSDATLLVLLNQLVKRVVLLRPDLFITHGTITPTASQVEQTLPATTIRLLEIHRVTSGEAIQETYKDTLDQSVPDWTTVTAGTPVNWMRHPRNPRRYFLYPAPSASITLVGEYISAPADYAIGATIDLPDAYLGALVDGLVFLIESIDTETVGSGRAMFYYNSFLEGFGVDFANRAVVDEEAGRVGEEAPRRQQRQAQ